ncbi:DUF4258 domain-containing protein [Candidatus Microgenomates bacterium]|nr:MAG: DUF4258 domain-containing protein [Candidatus Microgenomates bacterium]
MRFIWTKHAIKRLKERRIPQEILNQVLTNPDKINSIENQALEYKKIIDTKTFAAIVKENEIGEKIILSCWVNPPNSGTKDLRKRNRYFQMQKGSFLKKLWLTFLNQAGL